MFRIAIIGPGSICQTYGNALRESKKVELCAIAGRDTEKGRAAAAQYKVPYYTDQDLMYEKEAPDAVLICTPTYTHEEMVRRAIAHRVHVMCEKPFVLDAETAKQLFREAKDAGVMLMVMHVVRFWPEYVKIRKMIVSGELGAIKNLYLNRLSSHPTWATWHRDPKKSGGGLYDLHIHDIDFLYHVFGAVRRVYAVGAREESGCFNNVSTVLTFADGVSAVVEGFMDMTGSFQFTTNVRVNGSKASVELLKKTVYLKNGEQEAAEHFVLYPAGEEAQLLKTEMYNPYRRETEYFAECVTSGTELLMVPEKDVIAVLNILQAIQESLETGMSVEVREA